MNLLAYLVSVVVLIALGALWYGPLFGKAWMKSMGTSAEAMKEKMKNDPAAKGKMMRSYAIMALASLVMVFVLDRAVIIINATEHIAGFGLAFHAAFWNWLGFVAPVSLSGVLWEGKSWKWWCITAGYYLVGLCIVASIFAFWM